MYVVNVADAVCGDGDVAPVAPSLPGGFDGHTHRGDVPQPCTVTVLRQSLHGHQGVLGVGGTGVNEALTTGDTLCFPRLSTGLSLCTQQRLDDWSADNLMARHTENHLCSMCAQIRL